MTESVMKGRRFTLWSVLAAILSLCGSCSDPAPTGDTRAFGCVSGFGADAGFRFETAAELDRFMQAGCTVSEHQDFMVYYVPGVTDLGALGALTSVRSTFEVGYAESLERLDGLNNLERVERLSLVSNPALVDLTALASLSKGFDDEEVIRRVYVGNNDRLERLDGLDAIEQLSRELIIEENDALTSLDGLSNLHSFVDTPYDTRLIIRNNPRLATCEAEAFAARFDNLDEVIIAGNDDTASCE